MFEKISNQFLQFYNQYIGGGNDDLYALKSRLKIYLIIMGILVLSASSMYTYSLVQRLKEQELAQAELFKESMQLVGSKEMEDPEIVIPDNIKTFIYSLPSRNKNIPIIVTNSAYDIQSTLNISGISDVGAELSSQEMVVAKKKLNNWISKGNKPIFVYDDLGLLFQKVYYDDSNTLTLLKYYPFFQFALILFFIGFGYLVFSSTRNSEQNQVWVGMAKETAHQLGTPIAAIIGWIEHLKMQHEGDEATLDIVKELENDTNRLSLVADRFSKIGSSPELVLKNIYEELNNCKEYMQKRAPRRVIFDFPELDNPPQYKGVKINSHLFDWVIENLLRNALDAMEGGEGIISAEVHEEPQWISIYITDSGKGIPKNNFKNVFQPGFTTKKRGWGLGLSLAKRIIENYHGGKIFVKDSEVGKFTTFCIKMPKGV
jgi:uncharacterized protein YpmB